MAALELPCRLMWSSGLQNESASKNEACGTAVQLSSTAALALVTFGEATLPPVPGTAMKVEVLLPAHPRSVSKCIVVEGQVERTTELETGEHLVACRLTRAKFIDCRDPSLFALQTATSPWKM